MYQVSVKVERKTENKKEEIVMNLNPIREFKDEEEALQFASQVHRQGHSI